MVFKWLRKAVKVVTGRIPIVRTSYLSVTGVLHQADGVPNQDCAFRMMRPDINAYRTPYKASAPLYAPGTYLAGVFDGHGPQGESASALAAERMSFAIDRMLMDNENADLEAVVRRAFREVAAALNSAPCGVGSGTTGSIALVKDGELVIANVGDSKVLLLSESGLGRVCTRYASPVHRPTEEQEAARIVAAGGQVLDGYVVDDKVKNGIAVSRTLGDRDMHEYGCISEPDVQRFRLSKDDSAVILASDGLWDHAELTEKDVWNVASKRFGKTRTARKVCEAILEAAHVYGKPSDDCTIACLTLK